MFEHAIKLMIISSFYLLLFGCGENSDNTNILGRQEPPIITREWGIMGLVEANTNNAFSPQIEFDQNGNAFAVWIQEDDSDDSVLFNKFDTDSGSWGTEVRIGTGANSTGSHPDIAIDGQGNAIVVWEGWNNNNYSIRAARFYADSGTWGQEQEIETGIGGASYPKIQVNGNGKAIAVWEQYEGDARSIFANSYNFTTDQWGSEQLIENENGLAQKPMVVTNDTGDAIIVWQQYDGIAYSIYACRYDLSSEEWKTPIVIETGEGDATSPQVAMDQHGNAFAVWAQWGEGSINVNFNEFSKTSGQWSSAKVISIDDISAEYPQISMTPEADIYVVWRQLGDHHASIRSDTLKAWSKPERIENVSEGISDFGRISVDQQGNAMVVWEEGNHIYATYYNKSLSSWVPFVKLDTLDGFARKPQIAFGPEGNAMTVWAQGENDSFTESIFFGSVKRTVYPPFQ